MEDYLTVRRGEEIYGTISMKPNAKNVVSAEVVSVWDRVRRKKRPVELVPWSSQDLLTLVPQVPCAQPDKVLGEGQ